MSAIEGKIAMLERKPSDKVTGNIKLSKKRNKKRGKDKDKFWRFQDPKKGVKELNKEKTTFKWCSYHKSWGNHYIKECDAYKQLHDECDTE